MRMPIAAALIAVAAPALADAQPTVVELYQSQGCSSCPPANAQVNALADRPDLIALSFAVTYWDQLGWKDSFADPANTRRQRDYAGAFGNRSVFTPQIVVNGRAHVEGSDRGQIARALAAKPLTGPAIAFAAGGVTVAAGSAAKPADVWLVRYDPRTLNVPIKAGENGGRTLPHRNIVKQLVRLGQWTGAPARFALPAAPEAGLRTAAFLQSGKGGPIVAAAKG